MAVVIETTIGDFTVDLFTDQRPRTCLNFLKLCKMKYYNWSLFHTVQSNFIAQTGDPTGTGKGGQSIYGIVIGEEARYYEGEQIPKIKHDAVGLLSMVNCGANMLGSQFFITLGPDLRSLDGEHCVFGEITEGLEIILKLNETICDGENRPYQDIRISHTVILEDPYDDPKGMVVPDASPEPTKEVLTSDRIGADENIDDTAGMTLEERIEKQKEKEARARATILEIVGDLPDAEMAPPENVLFVCKLNPVTNDDDLEIIFSRFGEIVGCEVIRDRKTGDSLQYAFIEFADRKSCEEAYFKMDNVLIDDRRIHVDFSQSVAKMRWRGKGKGIKYYDDREPEREDEKRGKGRRGDVVSRENNDRNEERRYKTSRGSNDGEDRGDREAKTSRGSKERAHEGKKETRSCHGERRFRNEGKRSPDEEVAREDARDRKKRREERSEERSDGGGKWDGREERRKGKKERREKEKRYRENVRDERSSEEEARRRRDYDRKRMRKRSEERHERRKKPERKRKS